MDPELQAYDEAWNDTPKEERNALCQELADQYLAAHPELAAKYRGFTIPQLVALLEAARESGDEEERIRLDIYINAAFEYQNIGGVDGILGDPRELAAVNADGDRRSAGGA